MEDAHDKIHAREIRMRCLEAAAHPGAFPAAHTGGPVKAILESAQAFAKWVMDGEEEAPGVKALL